MVTVLFAALGQLEELVHDRESTKFKDTLSQKYAEITYNGLWWIDLKAQLDAFFNKYHFIQDMFHDIYVEQIS